MTKTKSAPVKKVAIPKVKKVAEVKEYPITEEVLEAVKETPKKKVIEIKKYKTKQIGLVVGSYYKGGVNIETPELIEFTPITKETVVSPTYTKFSTIGYFETAKPEVIKFIEESPMFNKTIFPY